MGLTSFFNELKERAEGLVDFALPTPEAQAPEALHSRHEGVNLGAATVATPEISGLTALDQETSYSYNKVTGLVQGMESDLRKPVSIQNLSESAEWLTDILKNNPPAKGTPEFEQVQELANRILSLESRATFEALDSKFPPQMQQYNEDRQQFGLSHAINELKDTYSDQYGEPAKNTFDSSKFKYERWKAPDSAVTGSVDIETAPMQLAIAGNTMTAVPDGAPPSRPFNTMSAQPNDMQPQPEQTYTAPEIEIQRRPSILQQAPM